MREFTHLSRFSDDQNEHIITLGIQLSKNHPILADHKFQADLQEKIKFNSYEVIDKDVSIYFTIITTNQSFLECFKNRKFI